VGILVEYENGWGMKQDLVRAEAFYERSAATGFLQARSRLDALRESSK